VKLGKYDKLKDQNETYTHVLAMLKISFYNLFQIIKQGRVASKVSNDDHDDLVCLTVTNDKACVGVNIKLKFGRVRRDGKRGRISFMSLIWLGAGSDMILPQVSESF
jgi:hypothetical protein